MGKQTAVAMTDQDEESFVEFLKETVDIQLLESSAPTRQDIWVKEFSLREDGHWQYYIWNKSFPWQVDYGQVTRDDSGQRQGWYYVQDSFAAPLIEYDRYNFLSDSSSYGRIYWAKYFAAPHGVAYNVNAFEKWYQRVARWIRRRGKQLEKSACNTYFLPDALKMYGNAP